MASLSDGELYPNYILPRLRPDQKFLATEFSLVRLYAQHLKDPGSNNFADRYGFRRGTLVWQVGKSAIQHPFPQAEWNDFLTSCPWFENNKNFMSDIMTYFRNTGRCAMAGWGLFQDAGGAKCFGPNSLPWVFNTIFCPYTCQQGVDGLPGRNVNWIAEFRSLQDPPDGRGTDPVSKLEQLTLNRLVASTAVLRGHPFDQPGDRLVNGRTPDPAWIGPFLGYQAPGKSAEPASGVCRSSQQSGSHESA